MPTGPLIGVIKKPELKDKEVQLTPGDVIVAYTDGVTDALNREGEMYGADRLRAAVAAAPKGAAAVIDHLMADLTAFTGDAPQPDDITLLVLANKARQAQ